MIYRRCGVCGGFLIYPVQSDRWAHLDTSYEDGGSAPTCHFPQPVGKTFDRLEDLRQNEWKRRRRIK